MQLHSGGLLTHSAGILLGRYFTGKVFYWAGILLGRYFTGQVFYSEHL